MENLPSFALLALALVLSPGPDTLLILRNAVNTSHINAWWTAAGVQAGLIVHTSLSVIGLSAILAASPTFFHSLGFAGSLYLGWLGWQTLNSPLIEATRRSLRIKGQAAAFRAGMLCNLLNPKVLLLFIGLIPNFVDAASPLSQQMQLVVLGAILLAINIPWQFLGLVMAANALLYFLAHARWQKTMQWILGGILLLFSIFLLIDHLPAFFAL